ncbi:MAG TPA: 16S rRNA (adenine(1518)-N(6)/adenine(1519)-N(6))-dimethyltransferase RsmA [Thermodesulfobacteriota bacterium]|nr:16S rRNA (adenine(1518)-N(6)/adenine(1519)-N(6))-dimethyltransferase RsmA [Thermodesulfobacteriota bacterium]
MTDKRRKELNPREFFRGGNVFPRKSLGQNFLKDPGVIDRIIEAAELSADDRVIEIGPGMGALTRALAEKAGKVIAIEKDERVITPLRKILEPYPNAEVVHADCLKIDFRDFYSGRKLKAVSNLPYSISTPVLIKLLEDRGIFSSLVLMLQLEVGQRITATPGGRQYGSLSVLVQTYMDVKILFRVPPSAFWPKPKVDSAVLKFVPLIRPRVPLTDERIHERVLRAAFSSRRKMLGNSLRSLLPAEAAESVLAACGIERSRRAETLSIKEFGLLANEVAQSHKALLTSDTARDID